MAVTFDHQTWGALGITTDKRYGSDYNANPTLTANNHTYFKDQALKTWLGDVNNVVLDISSLTGTANLADGSFTVELQRADRAVNGFNACKGLEITFDVYNSVIDPATIVITNKGYGGWMAGDVADITGDWQITIQSADASIGLLRGWEDATRFSASNYYLGWMFGIDRQVGSVGYSSGIWFYYPQNSADYARFQVFSNWQDLEGASYDNGYGTRDFHRGAKYAVYDVSDWESVDPISTLNFTYCADPGNSFFFFSGNNPNESEGQNNWGWGFVRLSRPAGNTYIANSSEWAFTYEIPNSLTGPDDNYTNAEHRIVTLGVGAGVTESFTSDNELPFSGSSGYLTRNQPVFCRGGLSGYMPPGLGWGSSYSVGDQMVDTNGDTWTKCHQRVWVKVQ